MLGWIMVHWKAQKALLGQRKQALTQESDHQHKVAPTQPQVGDNGSHIHIL